MNKAEIQYLQEKENARKERVKRQNEQAKKAWETVSCRLPIGTKKRIENQGFSINGLINKLILAELDKLENQDQKPAPAPDRLHAIEAEKKPTPDADEVQKLIDEKRKQYEREKEAEQTQEDAQKTRLFNMNDYK